MATATTSSIQTYLGAKADSLLGFKSPKISKERLHLPGLVRAVPVERSVAVAVQQRIGFPIPRRPLDARRGALARVRPLHIVQAVRNHVQRVRQGDVEEGVPDTQPEVQGDLFS